MVALIHRTVGWNYNEVRFEDTPQKWIKFMLNSLNSHFVGPTVDTTFLEHPKSGQRIRTRFR